jgi:hypothetical protein
MMVPTSCGGPDHFPRNAASSPDGSTGESVEVREIRPPAGETQLRFTNGSVRAVRMEAGDAFLGGEREYVLAFGLCLPAGSVLQAPVRAICKPD